MKDDALIAAIREAMAAERNGHQFYSMAAERSDDPGAREAFAALAEEERRHYEMLQARYIELVHEKPAAWDDLLEKTSPEGPTSPGLFSEAFHERLAGRHLEMSVLAIGVLLEKESIAFYARQAEETADPGARAFFRELVAWETDHYNALLRQQDALKEAYWNANRFEPLF
jgi:rubrerythrin